MSEGAQVKNAADPRQVKRADQADRMKTKNALVDLRAVLALPEGRRVLWRLMEHCQVFASIWHPSALIHANAGRQDVGHFIMAQIAEADEQKLFLMMQEAYNAKRIERQANEAINERKEDQS